METSPLASGNAHGTEHHCVFITGDGSRKKIFGGLARPSSFGRQQRLSKIRPTIEPTKNLGNLGKIWGACAP